jgi:ABC-type antimicrobial peptide transport system permease subunit
MAGVFTICGGVAVVLATVGLFGVTYYLALQRTREFGVRLALGSTCASFGGLVIGEAVRLATPGIVIGMAAAVASLAAARTLLYEVSVSSPGTYAIAAAAQWLMVVMASWVPAARASRTDPVEVLRSE